MADAIEVKREFIRDAMRRAENGRYPIIEPTKQDNSRELAWWIRVFDAKAFLFSENGSASWLFPHYELTLVPLARRVRVSFAGRTLVSSRSCFEFHETAHPTQIYVPRSEIDFTCLRRSDTLTYCPFKNIASYYSVEVDGKIANDAFWSYETIYDKLPHTALGILGIKELLSPDRSKLAVELLDD